MELITQDWYKSLIDDCTALIVETEFTARWTLVTGYHQLGLRILADRKNYLQAGLAEEDIVSRVTEDTGKSERTLSRAVQFAKKYPELDDVPGGKNLSWHKIVNELLPAHKDTPKQLKPHCPTCSCELLP